MNHQHVTYYLFGVDGRLLFLWEYPGIFGGLPMIWKDLRARYPTIAELMWAPEPNPEAVRAFVASMDPDDRFLLFVTQERVLVPFEEFDRLATLAEQRFPGVPGPSNHWPQLATELRSLAKGTHTVEPEYREVIAAKLAGQPRPQPIEVPFLGLGIHGTRGARNPWFHPAIDPRTVPRNVYGATWPVSPTGQT